jgi:hypothetical protein
LIKEDIMKKCLRAISIVLIFLIAGCAGSSKYMAKATPITGPSADKALVYFMRPSGLGFAINFQIWDDDQFIGLSQAKSFFGYQCNPGKHLFVGIAENKRGVEADLEAGKSYYIITQVRIGGWRARMAFIPVTQGSEFWGVVETYKQSLNFVEAQKDMLATWEAKEKAEIQQTINYLNTPEGKQYVVKLDRDDGR